MSAHVMLCVLTSNTEQYRTFLSSVEIQFEILNPDQLDGECPQFTICPAERVPYSPSFVQRVLV